MKHFWNWSGPTNQRTLTINGTIAEDSWLDDDITPQLFQDELNQGDGPVELWINSPGGDCIAASQIYTMLMNYGDDVNVKIDGVAASAASVIAMAGTTVSMAPTAMLMIHNPLTMAMGESGDMQKAIQLLDETKESIINAYELKTNLPREKISAMMDDQTWMNVNKAIQLSFADEMMGNPSEPPTNCYAYSDHQADLVLLNKLKPKTQSSITVKSLQKRLSLLGH